MARIIIEDDAICKRHDSAYIHFVPEMHMRWGTSETLDETYANSVHISKRVGLLSFGYYYTSYMIKYNGGEDWVLFNTYMQSPREIWKMLKACKFNEEDTKEVVNFLLESAIRNEKSAWFDIDYGSFNTFARLGMAKADALYSIVSFMLDDLEIIREIEERIEKDVSVYRATLAINRLNMKTEVKLAKEEVSGDHKIDEVLAVFFSSMIVVAIILFLV